MIAAHLSRSTWVLRARVSAACALVVSVALAGATAVAGAVPAAASPSPGSPGRAVGADGDLDWFRGEVGAPGAVLVVVSPDGAREWATEGHDGEGRAVDLETAFVWGSVSKPVTARIIEGLEAQGAVRADQPVSEILPELSGSELADRGTTLRDLVEHTSGLPHDLALTDGGLGAADASSAVGRIAEIADLGERGVFRYSSLGYVLLQAVVERVTGEPFADAMGASVAEVPPGHVPVFTVPRRVRVDADPAGFGYGYQAGSARRLGEFAAEVLRDPPAEWGAAQPTGRAGAWIREPGGDHGPLFRHSGAVPGYFAHVTVAPEHERAVILLANRYGEMDSTSYARAVDAVVEHRLGGAEPRSTVWPGWYRTILAALLLTFVATLLGVVAAVRRRRLRGPIPRTVAAVVGATAVAAVLAGPPLLLGVGYEVGLRWAPDVVVLLWAGAAGAASWALAMVESGRGRRPATG